VGTKHVKGDSRAREAIDSGAGGANDGVEPGQEQPSPQTTAEVSGARRAVAALHEPQLAKALRKVDALRKRNFMLRAERAFLLESLAKANSLACHDALTGLPNRNLLQDHFNQAVARAERQHKHVILLFLDLDGFKRVNDQIGHLGGDRLLQQVAQRLTSCIRGSDTACRFGGDEFVVLLTDIDLGPPLAAATDKIINQLAMPYIVDNMTISMRPSLGMATYPDDGTDYEELLRFADFGMYRSKTAALRRGER
jgi:diguanylate cyclase